MALQRIVVLDLTLKAAGIPFHGVELGASPPSTVVISFKEEATQEQKDAAQAIVDGFDYRLRRDLLPGQIASQIAALTVAQEVALRRRVFARVLLAHLLDAHEVIAALNLPVAIDEVVPT